MWSFFSADEGLSRGLTLLLREEDLEDSGLVFIMCLLLLLLGDGFNNLACIKSKHYFWDTKGLIFESYPVDRNGRCGTFGH